MKGAPQSYKKSHSPKEGGFLFRTTQLLQVYHFTASIPHENRVNAAAFILGHEYGHHFAFQKRTLAKTSANVTDVAQQPGVARFQI